MIYANEIKQLKKQIAKLEERVKTLETRPWFTVAVSPATPIPVPAPPPLPPLQPIPLPYVGDPPGYPGGTTTCSNPPAIENKSPLPTRSGRCNGTTYSFGAPEHSEN